MHFVYRSSPTVIRLKESHGRVIILLLIPPLVFSQFLSFFFLSTYYVQLVSKKGTCAKRVWRTCGNPKPFPHLPTLYVLLVFSFIIQQAPICFISDPIMFIIGSVPFHRCSRSWHTWFFIPSEWWVSQKLNAFVDSSPYGIISKKEFCLVGSTRSLDFLWLIVLKNDTFSSVFSWLLVALPFICIIICYIIYDICMRFSHELVFLTHVLYTMKAQEK